VHLHGLELTQEKINKQLPLTLVQMNTTSKIIGLQEAWAWYYKMWQSVCRQVHHDELIQVLVGDGDEPNHLQPLTIGNDTWTDIRRRSYERDPTMIGDPGGFWMIYFPRSMLSFQPLATHMSKGSSQICAILSQKRPNCRKMCRSKSCQESTAVLTSASCA
jgi:hypothetical protein